MELQKLNRNSIYIFVNGRLIRDRLILHAIADAYRNIIPPTSFPVTLLFLEMPPAEVDVNVHPSKTEVRFRQPSLIHDFVRDSLRVALMKARPAASFLGALSGHPTAGQALVAGESEHAPSDTPLTEYLDSEPAAAFERETDAFTLAPPSLPAQPVHLPFAAATAFAEAALGQPAGQAGLPQDLASHAEPTPTLNALASLKPLGQLRESFILATNDEGLWIVDQHVAHERILFEKVLREREVEKVQRQRLLMPLLIDLQPHQMVEFARIAEELERNGFEAEPFGPRTLAIKAAPVGLEGRELERMLAEVLEQGEREQRENLQSARTRIAASIACHAAIKVNMPLDPERMQWLLAELAKTEHPTSCPHGRPIALRYSWRDILRAFGRI
jgi:DNA mismatch repair protein MutL